jgi:hypothetical protein
MPALADLIPSPDTLTPKEARFFKYLLQGATPTEAGVLSFSVKSRANASTRACQVLRKFNIRLPDIMDNLGMNDEWLAQQVKGLCTAKRTQFFAHEGVVIDQKTTSDNQTRAKGVELACKLKNYLTDVNVEVNQQFNVVSMMRGALEREEKRLKQTQ